MKKTKLLMPLMGLTVLGAVAPVMTITSCNKDTGVFISSAAVGNIYDQTKMLSTNRIGVESLLNNPTDPESVKDYLEINFILHMSSVSSKGRPMRATIEKQGVKSETPFNIALNDYKFYIPAYSSSFVFNTNGTDTIAINKTVIQNLITENKEATFKFVVKFEELNEDGQTIKTQDVWFSLVACPTQHDVPTITPISSSELKASADGTDVTFTGLKFNIPEGVTPDFNTTYKFEPVTWMKEEPTGEASARYIYIDPYRLDVENGAIKFYGYCNDGITSSETPNFRYWYDLNLNFVCKEDESSEEHFVLSEWQCTATVSHSYGDDWFVNQK